MHSSGGLDLETAGFQRVRSNDKGRPGYDPGDLLKLYIYGYLNRIRSSRRLEVETHRNLEAIWLLRQLRPDFKTIADFRRDNRNAFRAVFRQFVRLCRELDLYGRELIAVDSTRIKAVNKRDRNFTRATLKRDLRRTCDRLDRYLDQMNEADADDAGGRVDAVADLQEKIASLRKRKETLERHRQTLDDTREAQLSLTDPDSRSMHPGTRVGVGYNVQMAVDTKHNLIAEQQVHSQGLGPRPARGDGCSGSGESGCLTRSMRSRTEATTRSKTLRTAKPPGSRPTFRSPSSNTTPPRTPTGAPLVSAWCRCIAQASASRVQARILSVTSTVPHAEAAVYANDVPRRPTGASSASRTNQRWSAWRTVSPPGPR